MSQSDTEREAAIRDCHRLYREPEYAEATVPVLLRQLDAARAEIAELTRELKALRQEFADVDGACDEAEARVAELRDVLLELAQKFENCSRYAGSDEEYVKAATEKYRILAKDPPR